jgi:hypothetical protein
MFDSLGGAAIYAEEVLVALAPILNSVANKLSVNGHTDAIAYSSGALQQLELPRIAPTAPGALEDGEYLTRKSRPCGHTPRCRACPRNRPTRPTGAS